MDPAPSWNTSSCRATIGYIEPKWQREKQDVWKFAADTNRDYRQVTGLPPIGGDEQIVRDYLHF
ncbi:MAG: hypothetical protein R3F11_23265 [Verrucomicrobiales bacterium]